jgi:hypothetical protein
MSIRRVLFGKVAGGASDFALRCSLPGFDVVTDDMNDTNKCSFNSDWTLGSQPLITIAAIGTMVVPDITSGTVDIAYPLPGGISFPYIDVTMLDQSGHVRDDWSFDSGLLNGNGVQDGYMRSGPPATIKSGIFEFFATRLSSGAPGIPNIGCQIQYVIFNRATGF